ncbi:hypothetical protein KCU92_g10045, partial [Aureobasidium melanogenum]
MSDRWSRKLSFSSTKSTLVTPDTEYDIEASSPSGKVLETPSEQIGTMKANLLKLAEAWSIDLASDLYRIEPKDVVPAYQTENDKEVVTIMLNDRRVTDPEYKAPKEISKLVKSKAKLAEFSDKELNRALVAVVNENGPLGVVDCLLSMGASVDVTRRASTNMWKKVTKKDQTDRRSDVLQTACGHENLELIELLAAWADQSTLDDSLSVAIVRNAPKKIEILLRSGADPKDVHDDFLNAVRMDQVATVVTVLSGTKNPCGRCKAMALIEAVRMGSTGLIKNLIASGADASFEEARALSLAISRFDLGATVTVISGLVPPTANQLDRAAAQAYNLASSCEPNLRLNLIEACLCAGAEGAMTERSLQDAVDSLNDEIVRLFLRYNVSVDANGGEALNLAVQKESDDIFDILLAQSISSNTWSNALISTPFAKERGQKFALDLLRKGASVDHRDGEPLVAAIDANHLDILRMFLAQSPAETSLSAALLTCVDLFGDLRLQTLSILLPRGLCQQALDDGLITLVMDHEPDHNAIRQLLHFKASPAASNGFSLLYAVRRRDLSLVQLLGSSMSDGAEVFSSTATGLVDEENWHCGGMEILRYLLDRGANPDLLEIALIERSAVYDFATVSFLSHWISSPKSYSLAFADVINLGGDYLQPQHFELVRLLLAKGASGPAVDYALIQALQGFLEGNVQEILLDALLNYGADVNSFQGLALYLAVGAGQPDVLRKLIKFGASREVMSKCVCHAVLCQHREQLAIDLIDVLAEDIRLVNMNHKSNVLIALQDHNTTALMMAAQYEQPELVEELVKHMSSDSVSVKDKLSRSALFFAAGNGDVRSTKALLECRPRSNDGSLHEAARQLYPEILFMLLKAGHDPNFVSTIHDGLTPLGELATNCDASERRNDLEVCLEQLKTHKVDVLKQWRGKTALFLAMDNPVAYPVTSALLERLMNNCIDDERNIFRSKKLNFSPTMYLKKGNFAGDEASCRALIELLQNHGATDRFFADAELDVQPTDAIGLPEPLRRAESERREHERNLKRAMDVHLQKLEMTQAEHNQRLKHDGQLEEQYLSYRELGQAQYVRHEEQKQTLYLKHQGQRFQQQLTFGRLQHEDERYQQQLTYEQKEVTSVSEFDVQITVGLPTYSATKPCNASPEECEYLYYHSGLSWDDITLMALCGSPAHLGLPCLIMGGPVQLAYFPVTTVGSDKCHMNVSTITNTGGPTSIEALGTTLTSGSVYLSFKSLYAFQEGFGERIGPAFTDFILPLPSSAISTQCGGWFSAQGPGTPLNYADLNYPWPASAYNCMNRCRTDLSFTISNGTGVRWTPPPQCSTIWSDLNPILAMPTEVRNLVPAWSTCSMWDVALPNFVFDPPRALVAGTTVATPTPAWMHQDSTTPASPAATSYTALPETLASTPTTSSATTSSADQSADQSSTASGSIASVVATSTRGIGATGISIEFDVGGHTFTASAGDNAFSILGQTISVGGPARVVEGETISLALSGFVVNATTTIPFTSTRPSTTSSGTAIPLQQSQTAGKGTTSSGGSSLAMSWAGISLMSLLAMVLL